MQEATEIPEKLYFKIGEVAKIAGLEPYVLRYWETEFKEINPVKSKTNQRLYRRRDIEVVLQIKELLYQEGFTIDGARKKIAEMPRPDKQEIPPDQLLMTFEETKSDQLLQEIRTELEGMIDDLQKN